MEKEIFRETIPLKKTTSTVDKITQNEDLSKTSKIISKVTTNIFNEN